ncbi:MAG TPA: hypothetical protein VIU61_12800 [Kofleriaceae bacterium]
MRFLIVATLCASAATASADGLYVTEAFGGTKIGDELGEHTSGGFRLRLGIGAKVAEHWAVDGWIAGAIPVELYNAPTLTTYGLDLKYINSLSEHFDLHLRGTVSRGHLSGARLDDYSGRGLGAGAGISAKGKVRALGFLFWPLFFTGIGPKVTAAVFVDSGYEFYRLHRSGNRSIDAQVTNMTLGFAVGSDF